MELCGYDSRKRYILISFIQDLVSAKQDVQRNPGASVTISLPLDDSNSQQLAAFARKLMIPTVKIRQSGLTTRTGIEHSGNAEEFLAELRKVIGEELFTDLMSDLGGQLAIIQEQEDDQTVSDPTFLPNAVHALGKEGLLANIPNRDKLVNLADDLISRSK